MLNLGCSYVKQYAFAFIYVKALFNSESIHFLTAKVNEVQAFRVKRSLNLIKYKFHVVLNRFSAYFRSIWRLQRDNVVSRNAKLLLENDAREQNVASTSTTNTFDQFC